MAAGRPTLFIGSAECEPAQIIFKSGAGIIVPPRDEKAVSKAINKLVNDAELRVEMGKRTREYYEQHFGHDRSVSPHNPGRRSNRLTPAPHEVQKILVSFANF